MDQEQIVEIVKSKDGKKRVDIRRYENGKYRIGDAIRRDISPPGNIHTSIPVEYPDLAAARTDAKKIISEYDQEQEKGVK